MIRKRRVREQTTRTFGGTPKFAHREENLLEWDLRNRDNAYEDGDTDGEHTRIARRHEYIRSNFVKNVIAEHEQTGYGHTQIEQKL